MGDPEPNTPSVARRLWAHGILIAAVGLLYGYAMHEAVAVNETPDFFIYRAGARLGLRGETPYDSEKMRVLVAEQFPGQHTLIDNCGYFLPPQAVLVYVPFAALPYPTAKLAWAGVNGLAGAAVLLVLRVLGSRPPVTWFGQLLPLALVANCVVFVGVELGQTSLPIVGCVAVGLWCFERRGKWGFWLGVLLWSVAFVKPHLALPLIPLAWYLGGWKRAAAIVAVVAVLNLLGATIAGGSPLFVLDYVRYLKSSHKGVMFNQVASNPEITSWNALLYSMTSPVAGKRFLIELTAVTTLAGYSMWFTLIAARCALAKTKPSAAWVVAATVVGALLCAQLLPYDLMILAVAVPWVRELFARGCPVRGCVATALLVVQILPFDWALAGHIGAQRPLGVALLAVAVLVGPVHPTSRANSALTRPSP